MRKSNNYKSLRKGNKANEYRNRYSIKIANFINTLPLLHSRPAKNNKQRNITHIIIYFRKQHTHFNI